MKLDRAFVLVEEATDELTHWTNFRNLYGMLEKGYIEGKQYNVNKNTITRKEGEAPKELCLVRKSNKNIEDLSDAAANREVRICFDIPNIKNIRGIKKPYPIAELPIVSLQWIERTFDKMIRSKMLTTDDKTDLLNMIKVGKPKREVLSKIISVCGENNPYLNDLTIDIENRYNFIKNREMEERLDLSKANIPISSKYIKIEIDEEQYKWYNKEDLKELLKLINTYKKKDTSLFVKMKK